MTNQPPTEKWMPLQCIAGECSLSRMEYDATNLLVELDSFLENELLKWCSLTCSLIGSL